MLPPALTRPVLSRLARDCPPVSRRVVITFLLVVAVAPIRDTDAQQAAGDEPRGELLWASGAPGATGSGAGDVPRWIVTRAESTTPTAGVVILPGGGYRGHAIGHEGEEIAAWFRSLGVTSAICTYRVRGKGNGGKGYGHPAPMLDAQRAIRMMRARADSLHVDPNRIGVIGFSAGGHLAATVSTRFAEIEPESDDLLVRISSRPDFAILGYPVISLGRAYTHGGSQRNLLGDDPAPERIEAMSAERQVTPETPPTFLFHTGEDQVVAVENAIDYYLACHQNGVPVEMHLFHEGRHGLGLAVDRPGADQWPALCETWLRRLGVVTQPARP